MPTGRVNLRAIDRVNLTPTGMVNLTVIDMVKLFDNLKQNIG